MDATSRSSRDEAPGVTARRGRGQGRARAVRGALQVLGGLTLVLTTVVGPASPSFAHRGSHSGRDGFTGEFGPYAVSTEVLYVDRPGEEPGVDFDLFLRFRNSLLPIDDATVTVTAHNGATTVGPLIATRYGNDYGVVIPDTDAAQWALEIEIGGPHGDATIAGVIPGAQTLLSTPADDAAGSPPREIPWGPVSVGVALAIGATGFTRSWRPVGWVSAVLLVAVCLGVFLGTWSSSDGTAILKAAAAILPLIFSATLVLGMRALTSEEGDGLLAVLFGSGGLAVLFGWAHLSLLTGSARSSALSPDLAHATVAAALGLGTGLMLLVGVLARSRRRVGDPPSDAAEASDAAQASGRS